MTDIKITGETKICGIIGDPIEHTMSPVMQNAAFREMGLDFVYTAFKVKPDDLVKAINGIRALNIRGMNVTIPHKVTVMPFLDKLDPLAEKIGAVNTITNENGILTGYNTDASGFLQALTDKGIQPEGKNVVILGAGGASRAISLILADSGAHLTILNRVQEMDWAEELAGRISQLFNTEVNALELNRENLINVLGNADILVNATSVGMTPDVDKMPLDADLLRANLTVYDIVYNPIKTKLVREAETVGARTVSGVEMLVWQGVLAFEKWTGVKAPVELMRSETIRLLKEHED